MDTVLGQPNGKTKKGREMEREKKWEIEKYERLGLSHLLRYFAGIAYRKKEERERDREREREREIENIWEIETYETPNVLRIVCEHPEMFRE